MSGKYISFLLSLLIASCMVGGCTNEDTISKKPVSDDYVTDQAVTGLEYTITIAKDIASASNVLSARYAASKNVTSGTYAMSSEIENVKTGLDTLNDIKDDVTKQMPAQTYESTRQNLLDVLQDAITHMTSYKEALENEEPSDISAAADLIWADWTALTGLQQMD